MKALFFAIGLFFLSLQIQVQAQAFETCESVRDKLEDKDILLVLSDHWNSSVGRLYHFKEETRVRTNSVVLGRCGMAWGKGLHGWADFADRDSTWGGVSRACRSQASKTRTRFGFPISSEGVERSPAGVFLLGDIYGHRLQKVPGQEVHEIKRHTICVDGPSQDYNQVVEDAQPRVSHEKMWFLTRAARKKNPVYDLLFEVRHNSSPAKYPDGSCIFFHIWSGPQSSTAGCTAMEERNLQQLIQGMDFEKTVLVQLPRAEYQRLKSCWGLPSI